MATFTALTTRVTNNLIDTPAVVSGTVPTLLYAAQSFLMTRHNFLVMKAEKQYITPSQAVTQTHVIGQIPTDWKGQRGDPYWIWNQGTTTEIVWQPSRVYQYREWDPTDPYSVGPPQNLLLGEAENDTMPDPDNPDPDAGALNIEVYPYPDGLSDWPDGNYRIRIPYWRYLPAIAGSASNYFTQDGIWAEFCVAFATWKGFMMDWDEVRAAFWMSEAVGRYDGNNDATMGGYAKQIINHDRGILGLPGRVLTPRRDVFAPVGQWRQ